MRVVMWLLVAAWVLLGLLVIERLAHRKRGLAFGPLAYGAFMICALAVAMTVMLVALGVSIWPNLFILLIPMSLFVVLDMGLRLGVAARRKRTDVP